MTDEELFIRKTILRRDEPAGCTNSNSSIYMLDRSRAQSSGEAVMRSSQPTLDLDSHKSSYSTQIRRRSRIAL